MLPGDLPDLCEKALGSPSLRRVGSDAAGLRTEAVFVVGAQGRDSSQNRRKQADMGLWCRSKPCKAKALREIAARGPSKPWCRNRPPNQCADNNNFQKRPHMVPSSLILPSALLPFLPLLPGIQPGANLPDRMPKPAPPSAGTPPSWRASVARGRHENTAVLRLRMGGVARRNGSAAVACLRLGRRRGGSSRVVRAHDE